MTTLYSGGLVFDGKGNLQENQGVLVDDQKISKVAPCGEFEGFSGDKVDTWDFAAGINRLSCPSCLLRGSGSKVTFVEFKTGANCNERFRKCPKNLA